MLTVPNPPDPSIFFPTHPSPSLFFQNGAVLSQHLTTTGGGRWSSAVLATGAACVPAAGTVAAGG